MKVGQPAVVQPLQRVQLTLRIDLVLLAIDSGEIPHVDEIAIDAARPGVGLSRSTTSSTRAMRGSRTPFCSSTIIVSLAEALRERNRQRAQQPTCGEPSVPSMDHPMGRYLARLLI
jgi:hypothetical protein